MSYTRSIIFLIRILLILVLHFCLGANIDRSIIRRSQSSRYHWRRILRWVRSNWRVIRICPMVKVIRTANRCRLQLVYLTYHWCLLINWGISSHISRKRSIRRIKVHRCLPNKGRMLAAILREILVKTVLRKCINGTLKAGATTSIHWWRSHAIMETLAK
jgi:hypothetical protein